jgi:hypothetical protein
MQNGLLPLNAECERRLCKTIEWREIRKDLPLPVFPYVMQLAPLLAKIIVQRPSKSHEIIPLRTKCWTYIYDGAVLFSDYLFVKRLQYTVLDQGMGHNIWCSGRNPLGETVLRIRMQLFKLAGSGSGS